MPTLAEVTAALDALFDPRTAEAWDAVGLVCGDPTAEVRRVHWAVDPVAATVDEALELGADLLVTHHPLLLRPVHGIAATTAKGRLVHRLVAGGCALMTVHTNADKADPGVSDALADAIGLVDLSPLDPDPTEAQDKLVVFVPEPDVERLVDALADAGAGEQGAYDRCTWSVSGTGTFRPLAGATPAIGRVGDLERVAERRVEMLLPRRRRGPVVRALRTTHPYEEPAFDLIEVAALPGRTGIGRTGRLPEPEPFEVFVARVSAALPETAWGVRGAGDPDRTVERVAVCGGAGDSLLGAAARGGADAYVTADLRHHPAAEALADAGPALVDVAHWASEWPWLAVAAAQIDAALEGRTTSTVSTISTDPWTVHAETTTHPDEGARP